MPVLIEVLVPTIELSAEAHVRKGNQQGEIRPAVLRHAPSNPIVHARTNHTLVARWSIFSNAINALSQLSWWGFRRS